MKCASNTLLLTLSLIMSATSAHSAPLPRASRLTASSHLAAGTSQLDFSEAARLRRQATLAGGLESAYARLDAIFAASMDSGARSKVLRTRAVMKWWDGDVPPALEASDAALELEESPAAILLKGRLLDVQGQAADAAIWYEKARAGSRDAPSRSLLDLRLAVISATERRPEALADLAKTRSVEASRRTASVLALLGYPTAAIALLQERGGSAASYVDQVRLANWAMAARDSSGATSFAWRAFQDAHNGADQRYALALMIEAFRSAGDLMSAARFLAAQPSSPEVEQARLDLLLELGKYDEAITLVDRSREDKIRQQLPRILKISGRETEAEAEYRRLLQAHPQEPQWYDDLATLYLKQGRRNEATVLYSRFFETNRDRIDVLTGGARRMIAMGLGDEARARLEEIAEDPNLAVPIKQFLAEEALEQGRNTEAEALLAELQRLRPADVSLLMEVSDDYERLGRKDQALNVLAGLEASGQILDYDQQLHMADLAFGLGRPEEALVRWRKLWNQSDTPARKSYLRRQIIKGASRLRQLDELAAELERRIDGETNARNDLDLLVEIRISQQDDIRARSAVERYATKGRMSETERLEQLAAIHSRLHQYAALDEDLSRLAEADPENADVHLRRLIVNTLSHPIEGKGEADRTRRVEELLARLRETAGQDDVENARFAAGVYAAAGMTDRAVEQYRRVVALAPADMDSLLELTSLLGRSGRRREAVALLQYEVESTDDPALLSAAISGLLDVLSSDPEAPAEQRVPADLVQASLAWAKRTVLERMIGGDDNARLFSLLGDVAQQRGEFGLQLRALEATMPTAGNQRADTLRQLIALTSERKPDANGAGDSSQKVMFARRLIALQQPLPPKVYANLAQALLEEGDLAGAERAFALMEDVEGLVNPDKLREDAYARSGHPDLALGAYKMAPRRGQDVSDPNFKGAVPIEQAGEQGDSAKR
ncbi:hypothetical protein [Phenylobacterium sp.]|uniref:tetratricopeptide repeat protein n=1 Tax=Phenylobacterium sp. TaxID=1871053 RepID=UPI0025EAEAE3|nr:hypothetical protein [Phenylobacterium sp.]MBX3485118.1 hypothetical protein [Phenylobacterium sp.]